MMRTRKIFIIIAIALVGALICGGGYFYVQNENVKAAAAQVLQQEQEAAEKAAEKVVADKAAAEKVAADKAAADKAAAEKVAANKAATDKPKPIAPSSSEVAASSSAASHEGWECRTYYNEYTGEYEKVYIDPTPGAYGGGTMEELIRAGKNPGYITIEPGDPGYVEPGGTVDLNEFFGIPADEPIIIDENMP